MRLKLVQIGNSRGLRIPTAWIRQYHWTEEVEAELTEAGIVLKPAEVVREGWEDRFQSAGSTADGVDPELTDWDAARSRFDEDEWTWS
jgi:antitoxin MazE